MNKHLKTMILAAMLVAVEVVLSRFCSISTQFGKIGFAFAPLAVCGMLLGPWWACLTGALADLLGAVLFPIGPYFPGFTLSNALVGLIFGLLLYRRFSGWKRIALAAVLGNFCVSLFLSTWWLSILYGSPYLGLLSTRLLQSCVMTAIEIVVLPILQKPVGVCARQLKLH